MTSLYKFIESRFEVEQDSEDHLYLFAESVLYLVGSTSAFEYQRHIKPHCVDMSAKKLRLMLQGAQYTNLTVKLYALRLHLENVKDRRNALKLAAKLHLKRSDAVAVWLLYSQNEWFRSSLLKAARKVSANDHNLTTEGIKRTFDRVFPSVYRYIKHVTYKKLRFLVKANNEEFQDFHQELSKKVSQAFYSLVPVDNTDAFIVNYLKRAAHNHAINIIKAETTQKRGRLINVGVDRSNVAQFSMLCVSENQMTPTVDADGNVVSPDAPDETQSSDKFELRFSISEILDKVRHQTKKYRCLLLMLGAEDPGFTTWLRQNKVCKPTEDNVDVQAREKPDSYTRIVADFLRVSYGKVTGFLQSLRGQLALA